MPQILHLALLTALLTANGFDISDALIPARDIYWGGVSKDGIQSIDQPKFVAATEADFLHDKDRVLGISRNGIAKSYPIRTLDRHEIVNDYFGDESVVVTYCPLCYSGMSFALGADSVARTFGVSGLLYNSDVLLYDRQTGSLWSQIMSRAVSGPLKGTEITPIVTANTTWRDWRTRFPETLVLSNDTGFLSKWRSSPYEEYQRSRQLMFPVANRSNLYSNKERVLGVSVDGAHKAYPFKELREHGEPSFADSVNGADVMLEWSEDDDYARVMGENGKEIPSVIVYWFAWYAFHTDTEVYQAE